MSSESLLLSFIMRVFYLDIFTEPAKYVWSHAGSLIFFSLMLNTIWLFNFSCVNSLLQISAQLWQAYLRPQHWHKQYSWICFFIDSVCLLRVWEGVSQSLSSYSLLLPQTSFSLPPQFLRPPEASSHR